MDTNTVYFDIAVDSVWDVQGVHVLDTPEGVFVVTHGEASGHMVHAELVRRLCHAYDGVVVCCHPASVQMRYPDVVVMFATECDGIVSIQLGDVTTLQYERGLM
jgi:hypothetical protein